VEIEIFEKFAIRYREKAMPDGGISSWWDIGQHLNGGDIAWSKDTYGDSRDDAIRKGRKHFG
jgi:hypothetical protein